MKSDERHDLQRNNPATGLTDLPGFWKRHGNKVLIVLTVAMLAVWAMRYRQSQAQQRQDQTRQALANAWSGLGQLPQLAGGPQSPEIGKLRTNLESEINQSVQMVVDDSEATPTQAAWAWLARGEMYWEFAHLPAASATLATPTTQAVTQATSTPASQPAGKSASEYLDLAANAYKQVADKYASEATAITVARFALAAIAEEKGDLTAARTQYKALIETPNFTTPAKSANPADSRSMAEARLAMLDSVEKPLLLLPATQPVAPPPGSNLMQDFSSLLPQSGPMPATSPATSPAASSAASTPATLPSAASPVPSPPAAATQPQ